MGIISAARTASGNMKKRTTSLKQNAIHAKQKQKNGIM
jgi:hypothetical protein